CYVGDYSRDSQAFLVGLWNHPADDPAFAVPRADYAMLGPHLLAALQTSPARQVHLSIVGMHHLEPETIPAPEYIPALKSVAFVPCNLLYVGRGGKGVGVIPNQSERPEKGGMVRLRAQLCSYVLFTVLICGQEYAHLVSGPRHATCQMRRCDT